MGGIELLATGRIDRLLDQYAVHVAVNQVSTGTLVTQANVQVPDLDGVFVAMRTLAAEVGQAIGDSDRQVTADAPLERVSTVSLDALRDYSAGMALINEFQRPAAEARLSEAVGLDPDFASALIMLAHCQNNQRRPRAEVMQLARRAFERAAGLPTGERSFIEGSYYLIAGDWARAITAYEALIRVDPYDFWGLSSLASAYQMDGRNEEAIPSLKQLALVAPDSPEVLYRVAARLLVEGDYLEEAERLVARATPLARPPLGRSDRVEELRRELRQLLAAADPDFILWRAVQ